MTESTFELERIRRPETLALLRDHVTVDEDAALTAGYPEGIPNRISLTTTEGTTLVREVRHPRGHARNPMSDEEVEAKYRSNVARCWSDERAERVADLVWNAERPDALAQLFGLLADGAEGAR